MMHDVDGAVPLPSKDVTMLRLVRPVAYQQFWHQQETFMFGFARQALLFDALPSNHTFQQWFKSETGVSINDFLELALIVAAPFFQPTTHYIEEAKYFQNLAHTFSPETIPNFLKALAKTPDGLKQYLLSLEEERMANSSEFREQSPLVRYPLLNLSGRYCYYSRRLLTHSLETFVYDTLRGRKSEEFMNRFGGLFQNYIDYVLTESGLKFYDENEISKFVQESNNRTDFLITEPGVNLFVEAKGVEVGHLGMTSYRPDVVTDRVKSSVVKGIQQGMNMVVALRRSLNRPQIDLDRANNFLLLVTYKDLLLGTGIDVYESYARDRLNSILGNDLGNSPIPLEHICIISTEEFDHFIAYAMSQRCNLAKMFREVSVRNKEPRTRVLFLSQHLKSIYGDVEMPTYLKRKADDYVGRVGARLK